MFKTLDKPLRLAFNIAALALIIVAIIRAFAPYLGGHDPRETEIRVTIAHILSGDAADIPALLEGQPSMLVVYASWCGPCRVEMPRIANLLREGRLKHIRPLFLSLDKEPRALAIYLVHHDYHTLFTPYLLTSKNSEVVLKALIATGSGFSGAIPYIGFFDARGKITTEFFGIPSDEELLQVVNKLQK